jgi:hypothetical protein
MMAERLLDLRGVDDTRHDGPGEAGTRLAARHAGSKAPPLPGPPGPDDRDLNGC